MDNANAIPAPVAAAVKVSALETLLREKATPEEREAVLREIGVERGLSFANELRAVLALDDLVMSVAEYYADRLEAMPEEKREELQSEIREATLYWNTYYQFTDGSELQVHREAEKYHEEYEVTHGADYSAAVYEEYDVRCGANGAEVTHEKSATATA